MFGWKLQLKRLGQVAGVFLLLLVGGYSILLIRRPPRTDTGRPLFQGVHYRRQVLSQPRPLMVHVVSLDLTAPGLQLVVTPSELSGVADHQALQDQYDTVAQTTSDALQRYQFQLVISGSFFYPFHEHHPLDFYPRSGDPVNVVGVAIADGQIYSDPQPDWAALCIQGQQVSITQQIDCPAGTDYALTGREIVIETGQPVDLNPDSDQDRLFPRTVVAIDQSQQKLWFVIVDGRQPRYSEGITLAELTPFLIELGADTALNLDGGGSTTLVIERSHANRLFANEYMLLNSPIHTRIPMRQRPIANHIGVYAQPLPAEP
ncbi:MAG: phosphodiester glycosidase family protein [Thainema sp.]